MTGEGGSTNAKEDQKEEVEENAEGLGRELGAPVGGGEELDKVRPLPGQPGLARGFLAQQRHVVIRHPELVHRRLCLSPAALHLYDAGVRDAKKGSQVQRREEESGQERVLFLCTARFGPNTQVGLGESK